MSQLTLLEIATAAAEEVLQVAPAAIYGSSDPHAKILFRSTQTICYDLIKHNNWQQLEKEYTFTTAAGTASYALPTDYQKPIHLSIWNRTNNNALIIANGANWQALKSSGVIQSGFTFYLTEANNHIQMYPTPADANTTIAFSYHSTSFCTSSIGTPQSSLQADTDIILLDGDLVTRGVKYKFASAVGKPYGEFKQEYLDLLGTLTADNQPLGIIRFGAPPVPNYQGSFPDGSFG